MDNHDPKQIIEAAKLLDSVLRKLVASERGIHAETVVAAAARMAGTMSYRAFETVLDTRDSGLRAGSVVLSDEANLQGPLLVKTLFATLKQLGHGPIDEAGVVGAGDDIAASRLTLAETRQRLEPWYRKTGQACGLSVRELSAAAAVTTGLTIHECRSVLDVQIACAIAVRGIVEGVKIAPAPLDTSASGAPG